MTKKSFEQSSIQKILNVLLSSRYEKLNLVKMYLINAKNNNSKLNILIKPYIYSTSR